MSDRNVCPKCGGYKSEPAKLCRECQWIAYRGETVPVDQGITPLELLNALISMCEGKIS